MVLTDYNYNQCHQELTSLLKKIRSHLCTVSRLRAACQYFMHRPYCRGALGEGYQGYFDQSPCYRMDQFDCLTYVNTVLALVQAVDVDDFRQQLLAINYYDGIASYQHRFHFMSVDWNMENAAQGIVVDITKQIAPVEWAVTCIDRPAWFRHRQLDDIKLIAALSDHELNQRLYELRQLADTQSVAYSRVPYIPLTTLFDSEGQSQQAVWARIPDGVIIEMIRPNWDLRKVIGTYLDISHVGMAFWLEGECWFYHASLQGSVVAQPLRDYLKPYCFNSSLKGINVQYVLSH